MPRRLALIGLAAALAGLALLARALTDATPLVFFGTEEERATIAAGRDLLPWASVVLAVAGTALLVAGRRGLAWAVAAPGFVCPALALGLPETLFAWLAFLALAPVAAFAALSALAAPRRGA
jgi:uncharacterized membrane protein